MCKVNQLQDAGPIFRMSGSKSPPKIHQKADRVRQKHSLGSALAICDIGLQQPKEKLMLQFPYYIFCAFVVFLFV